MDGNTDRVDDVYLLSSQQSFAFQTTRFLKRFWQPSLTETVEYYVSNQNAFDANQIVFVPSYYNFVDIQLNPALTIPVIPGRLEVREQAIPVLASRSRYRLQECRG